MKLPARVKIHIPVFRGIASPYDNMFGTAIGLKESTDKNGNKINLVLIRLDKPKTIGITTIGLPIDSFEIV